MILESPFHFLFHRFDDFRTREEPTMNEDERADVAAIAYILDSEITPKYFGQYAEIQRTNRRQFMVEWKMLWATFRRGDLVRVNDKLSQPRLFVFVGHVVNTHHSERRAVKVFEVQAWGLHWDKYHQRLQRQLWTFDIREYNGSKQVSQLPIYPLRCGDLATEKRIRDLCRARGHLWKTLIRPNTGCWAYDGLASTHHDSSNDYLYIRRNIKVL